MFSETKNPLIFRHSIWGLFAILPQGSLAVRAAGAEPGEAEASGTAAPAAPTATPGVKSILCTECEGNGEPRVPLQTRDLDFGVVRTQSNSGRSFFRRTPLPCLIAPHVGPRHVGPTRVALVHEGVKAG